MIKELFLGCSDAQKRVQYLTAASFTMEAYWSLRLKSSTRPRGLAPTGT